MGPEHTRLAAEDLAVHIIIKNGVKIQAPACSVSEKGQK